MTASELNIWIESNFRCFTGSKRAWESFPMPFDGINKVEHINFVLYGPEEILCLSIKTILEPHIKPDQDEILFWRRPFNYSTEDSRLSGRFGFWNNKILEDLSAKENINFGYN